MYIVLEHFQGLLTQIGFEPNFFAILELNLNPSTFFNQCGNMHIVLKQFQSLLTQIGFEPYFFPILELNLNLFTFFKQYGNMHIVLKHFQSLFTQIGFEPIFCHPGIEPKPFYILQAIWQYEYHFEAFSVCRAKKD